jgi:NAD(P)-dependent dehydrogenase (short-subunit alcohol dehydrogenase family)
VLSSMSGKVAVVTGSASGIGAALAEGLAREGMRVVAADIDLEGAEATAQRLGGAVCAAQVDVADAGSVSALADRVFGDQGQVDLLINNAGVFQGGLSWERSLADWEWALGVNLYGIIHAIRSFVPRMIAQDSEGHIVNTASVAAFVAGPFSSPYVVSKSAALSISECLALDLAAVGSKLGASVLVPSAIDTAIARAARARSPVYGRDDTPDGRMSAEAVASLTAAGIAPSELVQPVIDAIRTGTFLIPTKPSYANQIRNRADALIARNLPGPVAVD